MLSNSIPRWQNEANKVVSLGVTAPWEFLTTKFLETIYFLHLQKTYNLNMDNCLQASQLTMKLRCVIIKKKQNINFEGREYF
jgi:CRISPR/Cas system type I-B associated protein Csh2 (Cas7 group RAMP superfamily)